MFAQLGGNTRPTSLDLPRSSLALGVCGGFVLLILRLGRGWRLVSTRHGPIERGQQVVLPVGRVGVVQRVSRQQGQRGAHVAVGDGPPVFYPVSALVPVPGEGVSRV